MTTAVIYTSPEVLWARVLDRTVVAPNGCWHWTGAKNSKGYGAIAAGRRSVVLVHRLAVLVRDGHIDPDLTADHTCHNGSGCPGGITCMHRICVNPDHLEMVTTAVNSGRGVQRNRTRCKAGHRLTSRSRGLRRVRVCRTCEAEHRAQRREEHLTAA